VGRRSGGQPKREGQGAAYNAVLLTGFQNSLTARRVLARIQQVLVASTARITHCSATERATFHFRRCIVLDTPVTTLTSTLPRLTKSRSNFELCSEEVDGNFLGRRANLPRRLPQLHNKANLAQLHQHTTTINTANFWDLPRPVRDRIYRLNLVHEDVLDLVDFQDACGVEGNPYESAPRWLPLLLQLCSRTEQEAAEIFFGDNTFHAKYPHDIYMWRVRLLPYHSKLIRKFSLDGWNCTYGQGYTHGFRALATFESLNTLTVTINEQAALDRVFVRHATIKWHKSLSLSPQLHLQALKFDGISGLRSLRNIQRVDFKSQTLKNRKTSGERGDIIGGFLDTTVRREIARPIEARK